MPHAETFFIFTICDICCSLLFIQYERQGSRFYSSALTWVESHIKIAIFEVQRANNKTRLRLRMKIFFLFVLTNRAHKSLVFLSFGLGPLLQSWKTQRHPTIESTKVYPHNENGSSSSLCSWRDSRASDKWGRTCHFSPVLRGNSREARPQEFISTAHQIPRGLAVPAHCFATKTEALNTNPAGKVGEIV